MDYERIDQLEKDVALLYDTIFNHMKTLEKTLGEMTELLSQYEDLLRLCGLESPD
jgi:hypothetical protein